MLNNSVNSYFTKYSIQGNKELVLVDPIEYHRQTSYLNVLNLSELYRQSIPIVTQQLTGDPEIKFVDNEQDTLGSILLTFRDDTIAQKAVDVLRSKHNIFHVKQEITPGKYSEQYGQIAHPNRKEFEQSIANIINSQSLLKTLVKVYNKNKFYRFYIILDWFSAYSYATAALIMAMVKVKPELTNKIVLIQIFKNGNQVEHLLGTLLL